MEKDEKIKRAVVPSLGGVKGLQLVYITSVPHLEIPRRSGPNTLTAIHAWQISEMKLA